MDCLREEDLLAFLAFLEGTPEPKRAEELEGHLVGCPSCRSLVSQAATMSRVVVAGDGVASQSAGDRQDEEEDDATLREGCGQEDYASRPPGERGAASGDGEGFPGSQRFEVQRRLGAGAMGVVYQAFDRQPGTSVALKVLRSCSGEALLRFKNEFRALQGIRHPNLVRLGELFEEQGHWFFSMELVEGVSFLDHVRDHVRGVDEQKLRLALRQLALGLSALHAADKVHRDIKPSNVLVTAEGRVAILDFGLVAEAQRHGCFADCYLVGTLAYMAPEQARREATGPEADWYSVGVMLYQTLTGRLPVVATRRGILQAKLAAPPPPSALVADLPGDLDRLCVDLLQVDPRRRPTGNQLLRRLQVDEDAIAAGFGTPCSHFVGRQPELDSLRAAFLEVRRHQRPITVLLGGESGVGKSALALRFIEDLAVAEPDAVTLLGRCHARESITYKAIDGIVDSLSRHLSTLDSSQLTSLLPENLGLLTHAFPVLRDVAAAVGVSPPSPTGADPQELRRRVFEAFRQLLFRLGKRQPVVLLIDDLQWADEDSLALLGHLLRPPAAPRLLLLGVVLEAGAGGDDPLSRLTGLLPGEIQALSLGVLPAEKARQLARLLAHSRSQSESTEGESETVAGTTAETTAKTAAETAAKTLARTGAGGQDERLPAGAAAQDGYSRWKALSSKAAAIAEEAGGHPLYIDELVRWRLGAPAHQGNLRLEEVLLARVEALEPAARALLELLAVAGTPLRLQTVAQALGVELGLLAGLLPDLGWARLVKSDGAGPTAWVQPYHHRVRHALLEQLSIDAWRSWHRRLALALEANPPCNAEALAVHWREAGDRDQAAGCAVVAADEAMSVLAFDQAVRLYRMADDLRPLDGPAGLTLQTKLGDALANAGRGAEAAAVYLSAVPVGEPATAVELKRRAAEQLLRSGHIDRGLATLQAVLTAAGATFPRTPQAALLSLVKQRARLRLRGLGFVERLAERVPAEELARIDILWSVAEGLAIADTIRGADFQTRGLLLSLAAGEPYRVARALALEAGYSAASGCQARPRTQRLLAVAEALARRIGHPHALALVEVVSGMSAFLEGRFRAARVQLERGAEVLTQQCRDVCFEVTTAQMYAIVSMTYLGEFAELVPRFQTLLGQAVERGNLYAATTLRTSLASLAWLALGEPARARDELRQAIASWSRSAFHLQHYWALLAESQIDLYCGQPGAAAERVRQTWAALRKSQLLRIQVVRIEALYLRGRCALASAATLAGGERRRLLRAAEKDAAHIRGEQVAWADPMASVLQSGVAVLRGDNQASCRHLAHAARDFEAADMALFAAATRLCYGHLLGGEHGRALRASALAWMQGQGIRDPLRMAAMLTPVPVGSQVAVRLDATG